MANDRVEVILSAKDEFSRVFNSLSVKAGTVSGVVSASLTKAFDLSGASLRGLISITGQAIQAANEQEDAEKKLTVALGFRSSALIDQATALQRVTIFQDDQIVQAQAAIAMYVKDETQIKAATKATLDFASAKGLDLESASQLVAKTLGTETNALARQGVQVEGAVGSTERLNSVVSNLSRLFDGQAAAAAETFSGKTAQTKNALGELYEEVGGVITRNAFFIKGLDLVKQYLERATTWVNNNRLMLMNLTKDGIINLMVGIGKTVEVMRFFHNGWLGLKIVGNAVAIVFADALRVIFEGLRLVLLPLDLIYKGMVNLGVIASNPFDKASEAIGQFQLSSRDVMADVLKETETVNRGYDIAGNLIGEMTGKLREFKVEQVKGAEASRVKPPIAPVDIEGKTAFIKNLNSEILKEERSGYEKSLALAFEFEQKMAQATQYGAGAEETVNKWYWATALALDREQEEKSLEEKKAFVVRAQQELQQMKTPEVIMGGQVPEQVAEVQQMQDRLAAMQEFYNQKYALMAAAGASEAEFMAVAREQEVLQNQQMWNMKLAGAQAAAGMTANLMQNLMVVTGSKNKQIFETMKAFAIAEATISTYTSAVNAYKSASAIPLVGHILGPIAAAAAITAGLANVKKISEMEPGGGGGSIGIGGVASLGGYGGGAMSAYPEPQGKETKTPQNVTVQVYSLDPSSVNWDRITEQEIVPALNRAGDRNVQLQVNVVGA